MALYPAPPTISLTSSARVLVLTCIDPRFTELTNWFLVHVKQVHASYDLFALAGSTVGVVQDSGDANPNTTPTWPVFPGWYQVFFDHVKLAVILHGITEIWLFDHLGCSAYEQFLLNNVPDTLAAPHLAQMLNVVGYIRNYDATGLDPELKLAINNLKVSGFLMNLDGSIRVMVGTGLDVPSVDVEEYNKKTYYWTSGAIVAVTAVFITWIILHYRDSNK